MRILITGDRHWTNWETMRAAMRDLPKDTAIIQGGATGADAMAQSLAKEFGLGYETFPADWSKYGYSAGPIRNQLMVNSKPDEVWAFHSDLAVSKGTKNCVKKALEAGLKVKLFTGQGPAQDL